MKAGPTFALSRWNSCDCNMTSTAEPLSRVVTNANPRQLPMPRTVTLPAMGRIERLRRWNQIAPQASRQCSRRGCSTAVASLARHVICSPRLVPRTGRHMPRQTSRSLGGAVAARRQLPLPCKHVSRSRKPFRFAPGRASPRGCGGAAPASVD